MELQKAISLGPWGSRKGESEWNFNEDGSIAIKQIIIRHGGAIDSIFFKAEDSDGITVYSPKFGGRGGCKTTKIDISWPQEYIICISGSYGYFRPEGPTVIRSLQFITNITKYGPIGPADGTGFSLPMTDGVVVGFHGRSGQFLDSIGVFVKPTTSCFPSMNGTEAEAASNIKVSLRSLFLRNEIVSPPGVGPWGGPGGKPFDDGAYTGIKQIFVVRAKAVIHSILIEYEKASQSIWSQRHGGPGGDITNRIKFEYPGEYLMSITGFYGAFDGQEVIKCLSFYTTKGRYGPFGEETGIFFTSSDVNAKIVGLHGRTGLYLDAIGVLREYF